MRPLPFLGFIAGLAMLGWGGYSLYARFTGPEEYWGRDREARFQSMTETLNEIQTTYAENELQLVNLRAKVDKFPAGPVRDEAVDKLDERTKELQVREKKV